MLKLIATANGLTTQEEIQNSVERKLLLPLTGVLVLTQGYYPDEQELWLHTSQWLIDYTRTKYPNNMLCQHIGPRFFHILVRT